MLNTTKSFTAKFCTTEFIKYAVQELNVPLGLLLVFRMDRDDLLVTRQCFWSQ